MLAGPMACRGRRRSPIDLGCEANPISRSDLDFPRFRRHSLGVIFSPSRFPSSFGRFAPFGGESQRGRGIVIPEQQR